jgi:hypothetical protein
LDFFFQFLHCVKHFFFHALGNTCILNGAAKLYKDLEDSPNVAQKMGPFSNGSYNILLEFRDNVFEKLKNAEGMNIEATE